MAAVRSRQCIDAARGHADAWTAVGVDELDWLDPEDADAFPEFFRGLLRRARRRGELGRGVHVEAATQMLIACISGLAALDGSTARTSDLAAMVRAFERMLHGDLLRPEGPRRRAAPRGQTSSAR